MFLSIGVRMVVNVEALNMVESVGNVVRKRTVPYVVSKGAGSYVLRWVPAISGECLAHSYQAYLSDIAQKLGESVCEWCKRHEFIKHFDLRFWNLTKDKIEYHSEELKIAEKYGKKAEEVPLSIDVYKEIEHSIVKTCTVEDIGGFLVTQGAVKRTSRFSFSYAVPTIDSVLKGAIALDNQFLVRHAPQAEAMRQEIKLTDIQAQAPYYVQLSSAVYSFMYYLDILNIGRSSISGEYVIGEESRKRRINAAILALSEMLDNRIWGAKLTRYNPIMDYELIIATLVDKVQFQCTPPSLEFKEFVESTLYRALKVKEDIKDIGIFNIYVWCSKNVIQEQVNTIVEKYKEKLEESKVLLNVIRSYSVRDLFGKIIKDLGLR
ncbi:MAG: type I-A CRISPR-associated protein Cas7/Csa2 [Thermoprotei archaeon]|nr:MAG: type I-A CRISPR-associated protein Cas7/Csa2 [Thermoprotei archaeon]RLF22109.1 MAG: type I-A CRISPR-associated protein Cas7/Csa2 [Thermoprotei archaeon]